MNIQKSVFTGYANGDLQSSPVPQGADSSEAAAKEMEGIGKLTNAGFRTLVASAWMNEEKKTAGFTYVAVWEDNETQIILKSGEPVATSMTFYQRWSHPGAEPMTCPELLAICQRMLRN